MHWVTFKVDDDDDGDAALPLGVVPVDAHTCCFLAASPL